jgi:hypothetical protein
MSSIIAGMMSPNQASHKATAVKKGARGEGGEESYQLFVICGEWEGKKRRDT